MHERVGWRQREARRETFASSARACSSTVSIPAASEIFGTPGTPLGPLWGPALASHIQPCSDRYARDQRQGAHHQRKARNAGLMLQEWQWMNCHRSWPTGRSRQVRPGCAKAQREQSNHQSNPRARPSTSRFSRDYTAEIMTPEDASPARAPHGDRRRGRARNGPLRHWLQLRLGSCLGNELDAPGNGHRKS